MSTATADLGSLLHRIWPGKISATATDAELAQLSSELYPEAQYSDKDKTEISQWLITSSHLGPAGEAHEDAAKRAERLGSLNIHLSTRTTLLGSKPSVADIGLWSRLSPSVKSWSSEERTGEKGYRHIVRHLDLVQNSPLFGLAGHLSSAEKVAIDVDDVRFVPKPVDAKAEKERKKKEKAAASGAAGAPAAAAEGDKAAQKLPIGRSKAEATGDTTGTAKELPAKKKDKKDKSAKAGADGGGGKGGAGLASVAPPLSPRLIDLRVGHIIKAVPHPNADSLYVSTIACGDAPGTDNTSTYPEDAGEAGQVVRTVCSGLNGLIPLEEMQGRKVVVVCNLKPVTMRGVKSAAMVLAASQRPDPSAGAEDAHGGKGKVELVDPPAEAQAGERVNFEGWEGEPEGILNPKKKIFETLQPGLLTTEDDGAAAFDPTLVEAFKAGSDANGLLAGLGKLKTKSGGICMVKSLRGATVR